MAGGGKNIGKVILTLGLMFSSQDFSKTCDFISLGTLG